MYLSLNLSGLLDGFLNPEKGRCWDMFCWIVHSF